MSAALRSRRDREIEMTAEQIKENCLKIEDAMWSAGATAEQIRMVVDHYTKTASVLLTA
jgi:hypothetical protein